MRAEVGFVEMISRPNNPNNNAQKCRSANVTNVKDLCNAWVFEIKTYLSVIKNKNITKNLFVLKFLIF